MIGMVKVYYPGKIVDGEGKKQKYVVFTPESWDTRARIDFAQVCDDYTIPGLVKKLVKDAITPNIISLGIERTFPFNEVLGVESDKTKYESLNHAEYIDFDRLLSEALAALRGQ